MLLSSVAAKTFRDRLRLALYSGVGMGALAFLGSWMFSGLANEGDDLFADLPEAFESLIGGVGGGANYFVTETFGLIAPIVCLVIAIGGGVAALAGEERSHTAGLLFAQPVTRRGVVTAKAGVMAAHVVLATVILLAGFALATVVFDDATAVGDIAATSVHLVALSLAFGMLALALSVATGSATTSTAVAAGLAVAAYLSAGLLPLSDSLDGFERVSPWYYYNGSDPLNNGLDLLHVGVLVGLAALGFAVAIAVVAARDIGSGGAKGSFALPAALDRLTRLARPRLTGLFAKALSERVTLVGVAGGGLAAMAVAVSALYPGFEDSLAELSRDLSEGIAGFIGSTDLATPAGWINAEILSIIAPLVVIGAAVWLGAGAIAGEEQRHTLDLLLAAPVRRRQVVANQAAALVVVIAAIVVLCGLGIVAGSAIGGLDLAIADVAGAMAHLGLLGVFFGFLALALGSITSYQLATRITVVAALVSYLVESFFPQNDTFADWAVISPWHYYSANQPIAEGADPTYLAVLATLSVLALAASVPLVERREVSA